MKRILIAALALFVIIAPPLAVASAEHRLYLPQILSDSPRIVRSLGPCGAPLECTQSPVGYP